MRACSVLQVRLNNLGLKFAVGEEAMRCNSLAAYWIWQRVQHETSRAQARSRVDGPHAMPRFDADVFTSRPCKTAAARMDAHVFG